MDIPRDYDAKLPRPTPSAEATDPGKSAAEQGSGSASGATDQQPDGASALQTSEQSDGANVMASGAPSAGGQAAVPAGYRLGDGWRWRPFDQMLCTARDADGKYRHQGPDTGPYYDGGCHAACPAHAVEMGALVPIEPPVAEPAQPVCSPDCGKIYGGTGETQWAATSPVYCTPACAENEAPLNPPPVPPGPVPPWGEPGYLRFNPFSNRASRRRTVAEAPLLRTTQEDFDARLQDARWRVESDPSPLLSDYVIVALERSLAESRAETDRVHEQARRERADAVAAIQKVIDERDEQRERAERAEENWRLSERLRGTLMNKWHVESFRAGWADGAKATRDVDVAYLLDNGWKCAPGEIRALPLPVCPKEPPATKGGE